jgi:hypothetical protein
VVTQPLNLKCDLLGFNICFHKWVNLCCRYVAVIDDVLPPQTLAAALAG